MKFQSVIFSSLLLLAQPAIAAEGSGEFAAHWPINTRGSAPYYRLSVPLAAYQASAQGDLRDLRIFNAAGQPVPHARLRAQGGREEQVQRHALRWFPLHAADPAVPESSLRISVRQASDGSLIQIDSAASTSADASRHIHAYLFDLGSLTERNTARALIIDWQPNGHDFQLVDLESSEDLQRWRPLASAVQLARLDYQDARIEQRRIEFSGVQGRYLRLRWRTPAAAPALNSVELELAHSHTQAAPLAWSALLNPEQSERNLKPGEFRFRLPQALPLARLRFELPPGNQLLPLEIRVPGREPQPWRYFASGVIYRVESEASSWSNTEIKLPGQMLREFIVRTDSRLAPPALQLSYALQPDEIVFLASGTPPWQLAVGQRQALDTALPINTLVPGFGQPAAPEIGTASLDNEAISKTAALAPEENAPPDWQKRMLWGVLILGVLVMAAMAWSLLRQLKQQDAPPDEP